MDNNGQQSAVLHASLMPLYFTEEFVTLLGKQKSTLHYLVETGKDTL